MLKINFSQNRSESTSLLEIINKLNKTKDILKNQSDTIKNLKWMSE